MKISLFSTPSVMIQDSQKTTALRVQTVYHDFLSTTKVPEHRTINRIWSAKRWHLTQFPTGLKGNNDLTFRVFHNMKYLKEFPVNWFNLCVNLEVSFSLASQNGNLNRYMIFSFSFCSDLASVLLFASKSFITLLTKHNGKPAVMNFFLIKELLHDPLYYCISFILNNSDNEFMHNG